MTAAITRSQCLDLFFQIQPSCQWHHLFTLSEKSRRRCQRDVYSHIRHSWRMHLMAFLFHTAQYSWGCQRSNSKKSRPDSTKGQQLDFKWLAHQALDHWSLRNTSDKYHLLQLYNTFLLHYSLKRKTGSHQSCTVSSVSLSDAWIEEDWSVRILHVLNIYPSREE